MPETKAGAKDEIALAYSMAETATPADNLEDVRQNVLPATQQPFIIDWMAGHMLHEAAKKVASCVDAVLSIATPDAYLDSAQEA